MITLQKMVMPFEFITSWTVWTIVSIKVIDYISNRENSMSPFEEEGRSAVILIAYGRVKRPVDVTGEGPQTGRDNVLVKRRFVDHSTNGVGNVAIDGSLMDEYATNAARKE